MTAYSIDIYIEAPVADTEVPDRVADAITNLFPGADVDRENGRLTAVTHTVEHFSELLHRQAILDTARGQFFEGLAGDTVTFQLKKQAAFEGVVNFAVGPPDELGELTVTITVHDPDPQTVIDAVAPPTEDGVPVRDE
jgi:predicted RNA binding protein with dsRBD fold (UPF0201 family)